MQNVYLKSMHDFGVTVLIDEATDFEDAINVAKGMIKESDPAVVEYDYDEESGILRGFDDDDTESMYYATFEEKRELTLAELDEWFDQEHEDLYDEMEFLSDPDNW